MLHIVTALYRPQYIEDIYNSIYMDNDIVWHISKSNQTEKLNHNFIKNDKRIKVYEVDCDDSNTTLKRNYVLDNIKNGYFCFLDDDTIFHENMYIKYRDCQENGFVGMLVGEQLEHDGKIRLKSNNPNYGSIDTGNVLCHSNCLEKCRWPELYEPGKNHKDFLFWESVYNFYGKKCEIWNKPISYYNKLKPKKWYQEKKHIQ